MEHAVQWNQMVDLVTTAVTTRHSLLQHHFNGESKFIFDLLQKIMTVPEPLMIKKDGLVFKLEVGRIHVERPLTYDAESNTSHPSYPHQARWTDTSYTAGVKCDFVFKLMSPPSGAVDTAVERIINTSFDFDEPAVQERTAFSQTPQVHQSSAFTINAGEVFVGVRGDLCRIKGSGMLCREDPDIEGGFHIYNGSEKVTESQFVQRTNHVYVHFLNSSTSTSQSTTASEATNVDSTTADSPIILQCDYRPFDDDLMKAYSAFHIFLVVEKPKRARQMMQRQMERRKLNALGHFESSSSTEPIEPKNFLFAPHNATISGFHHSMLGVGESLTILFPNVDEFNLNLVLVLFLLGLNDRPSMLRCIIPNECHLLEQHGLINSDASLNLQDLKQPDPDPLIRHAILIYYQVYTLVYNQTLFVPSDQVDPRRLYYSPSNVVPDEDLYLERKGTYEYIVANLTPFVGQDYAERESDQENASEVPSQDFVRQYHEATLDGWDRSAALAHIARLILVRGSQKKKSGPAGTSSSTEDEAQEQQKEAAMPTKYARDYGVGKQSLPTSRTLPDAAEGDRLHKALARFAKSFAEELLPHIGTSSHWRVIVAKRTMLGFMVKKMALVFMGYVSPDLQDDLKMKRCEIPAQMMARVWSLSWQKSVSKFFRKIIGQVDKARGAHCTAINWQSIANSCFPASPFTGPMDNGVWPRGGATVMNVKGCTKRLQYANSVTFLKAMRLVHTITNEKGGSRMKDSPAQQVDVSHYQMLCPEDTANDKEAGIDLNFAIGTKLRIGYTKTEILAVLMQGASQPTSSKYFNHFVRLHDAPPQACATDGGVYQMPPGSVPIFVNGMPVGFTCRPSETLEALHYARIQKFLAMDIGITWVGGPVGTRSSTLRSPFFNYIDICGDWGATLSPFFDTRMMYKLPAIAMAHSTAHGIYPNFTLASCVASYSDPRHFFFPPNNFLLAHGMFFDALVREGVVVYRDVEELKQEYVCPSVRDLLPEMDWYMNHARDPTIHLPTDWNDPDCFARHTLFKQGDAKNQDHKRHGLCVISEALQLGVTASAIPYINSDDPCRASYATGMTAQSTGAAPLNLAHKKNIYHMYLLEPKRSLSLSRDCRQFSIVGASNAAIPSLTCFYSHGSNGEDAVLRTRSPWSRYNVTHIYSCTTSGKDVAPGFHPETIETVYQFANPKDYENCLTLKSTDYSNLNSDGVPKIGSTIKPGAATIGRVFAVGSDGSAQRDGSVINASRMILSLWSVTRGKKMNGLTSRVVRALAVRVQVAGDKTSSEHGQKGVATIISRADSPYTRDRHGRGCIPHKFRPPAGVPSRTTMAEQRAMMHAAISIAEGRNNAVMCWEQDFGVFGALEKMAPNLLDCSLINPDTGVPLKTSASMGVLDFRLMRHLARETFNSRALGAVDPKTGQPTQGTKRRGGSREGPLESLNKLSQGATDVIESVLFTSSDPGFAHICISCGLQASSASPQVLLSSAKAQAMACVQPNKKSRARLFASRLANAQGGLFHSADATSPLMPSGGWCSVCKRGDDVYRVPMAKVTRQLVEYGYLSHQAWRVITNASVVKARPPLAQPSSHDMTNLMAGEPMQNDNEQTGDLNFTDATLKIVTMASSFPFDLPSPIWYAGDVPDSPVYDPL